MLSGRAEQKVRNRCVFAQYAIDPDGCFVNKKRLKGRRLQPQ